MVLTIEAAYDLALRRGGKLPPGVSIILDNTKQYPKDFDAFEAIETYFSSGGHYLCQVARDKCIGEMFNKNFDVFQQHPVTGDNLAHQFYDFVNCIFTEKSGVLTRLLNTRNWDGKLPSP